MYAMTKYLSADVAKLIGRLWWDVMSAYEKIPVIAIDIMKLHIYTFVAYREMFEVIARLYHRAQENGKEVMGIVHGRYDDDIMAEIARYLGVQCRCEMKQVPTVMQKTIDVRILVLQF